MGNAYDYMNPRIIICDNNGCHEATSKEIQEIIIIQEILEEMRKK